MAPFRGTGVQDDDEVISELLEEDEASAERRRKRDWIRKFMQSSIVRGAAATAIVLLLSWLAVRRRKRLNQRQRKQYENAASVPLSLLIRMVQEGTLEKILISTSRIFFRDGSSSAWSKIDLPANTALQNKIYSLLARSKADISTIPEVDYVSQISTAAFAVLPFVYLALVYRMMNRQFGGDSNSTKGVVRKHQNVTFRDVAGIDSVVQEVQEIVDYLKDPRRYHSVGATTPSGVLLYGPPGTGKTLLAQAVAGEASVDCFLACSASDFVELYVGRGASRIRALFQTVRREATRNRRRWWNLWKDPDERPCSAILFIDELDALAKTRSSLGSNDEREQTLNQLLTEMDGFQHSKEEVTIIVMAASNRADVLDPAILRRFDRRVHVGYPDVKGREAILRVHARRVALSDPIDWESLAELSTNLSGVDLRNAVNEAALLAVRDDSRVCHGHLEQAILRVKRMKELVSSAV